MNIGLDHGPADRGHNQHSERTGFEALLVLHVLVAGEENVETFSLDQRQQRAVRNAAPLHADHRMNFMSLQRPGELMRHVFIEQNLQGWA